MRKTLLFILLSSLLNIQSNAQQTVGLFYNDSTSYNGYTLFAPLVSTSTYLIDNCGLVVKTWSSNYRPGSVVYLLEDGTLLRTCNISSTVFNGGGKGGRIERYDWDGTLTWAYNYATNLEHQHHDVEFLPNGNILILAWETIINATAISAGRNPALVGNTLWSEKIVEIQPIGIDSANVVWEWHLWDHLIQDFDSTKNNYGVVSEHPELLDVNFVLFPGIEPSGQKDWIHANSVDYNPSLDQILISSNHLSEIWVIDHSTTTAEAASHTGGNSGKGGDFLYRWGNPQVYDRGTSVDQKFFRQHNAQWITDGFVDGGKIMVFNNGWGRVGGTDYSSVDVIAPPINANGQYAIGTTTAYAPTTLDWIYTDTPPTNLFSLLISGASRLPNGNTLICEGMSGQIFEVDILGNKVWRYVNPINSLGAITQGGAASNNGIFRAYRYGTDYPAFIGKTLTPTIPLEQNPLPSNCVIYSTTTHQTTLLEGVKVLQNPISDQLIIENLTNEKVDIQLIDLVGRSLLETNSNQTKIQYNIENLPKGLYVVVITNQSKTHLYTQKVIIY